MYDLPIVAEIAVSYSIPIPPEDRHIISNSKDAYDLLAGIWNRDLIEYQEQMYLLLLDKANGVIGYRIISSGGLGGTVVDVKQVIAICLIANAAGFVIAHNHPSGVTNPSKPDIDLTKRLRDAGALLDLPLLDHLIISATGYYSFSDSGV